MTSTKKINSPQVAVIGAGIAGLAAAHALTEAGISVQVYEAEAIAGGRIRTDWHNNRAFDSGANWFVDNYSTIKGYAHKFKLDWVAAKAGIHQRIVKHGQAQSIAISRLAEIIHFPLLSPWARLKLCLWLVRLRFWSGLGSFYHLSESSPAVDFDTASHYLRTRVHPEVADYVADPFTGAMEFHLTDEISTTALFALMRLMIMPNSGFAVRYSQGGMATIPAALAKNLPIFYGTPVRKIEFRDQKVLVSSIKGTQSYAAVVLATPAPVATRLLTAPPPHLARVLKAAQYSATIVLAALVPERWFSDGAHCTYIPYVESALISCYCNESQKSADCADQGQTLMTIYLYEATARRLMAKSEPEIWRIILAELPRICPEYRDHLTELSPVAIARWPLAMPKFDHGYVSLVAQFEAHEQGQNNLFLAGDYLNAPWTEGAARSGVRAATALIAQLTKSHDR